MAESFFAVPPDSTGKKIRTRDRVVGANTVHEQAVYQSALPTYYALADAVAFAANKQHISILNAVGSGKVVAIRKLFHINLALAAITGVACRFDVKRITAHSGGAAVVPQSADSDNPALAGVTVITGATSATEGAILYPVTVQNDEIAASNAAVANYLAQMMNLQPESMEMQELRLRPGEGMTVKQITSTAVGSFAWLMCFTVDDDV